MDDALLAGEVREERLRRLMVTYGTSVLRMCRAYLRDDGLAEDAAQDTFVKAFEHLDGFDARESWSEKAWLMRIAVNTCKDYRRGAWFRLIDRRVVPDDRLDGAPGLDADERTLLEDVMALPTPYKTVVLLYYYQDLRAEEIAQILGVSRSTVYSRLEKAQKRLRATLDRGVRDE